ncbi:MAG: ParB N-terminal domain-containing protein [Acidobacteria bacterium]|nr:ParB N-terminal domain-containing protein [Acidobacteriota bacterium]
MTNLPEDGIVPKAFASEIPVWCAHDKIGNIEEAIPNPENPNEHPEAQIELLANIIKVQGWRAPITVSKRSGFITKGHARLEAARYLGVTEIPLDYQDYANEAAEYADLVADNRIAELAERNLLKMRGILDKIDGQIDLNLTGYGADSIALIRADNSSLDMEGENPYSGEGGSGGEAYNDTGLGSDTEDEDYGEAYVVYLTFQTKEKAQEFLETMGRPERFRPGAKTIVIDMETQPN